MMEGIVLIQSHSNGYGVNDMRVGVRLPIWMQSMDSQEIDLVFVYPGVNHIDRIFAQLDDKRQPECLEPTCSTKQI